MPASHALALACGGVAGTYPGPDLDVGVALFPQCSADAAKRRVEILPNVVRERLKWGDVDDLGLIREPTIEPLLHKIVNRRHESGQSLS
jgi:hypothetical protein